jgi:hypothetical protein
MLGLEHGIKGTSKSDVGTSVSEGHAGENGCMGKGRDAQERVKCN